MYDIYWDEETGGILLTDSNENGIKREIRPVFYEELDLLGFDEYWDYPRVKEPLLWAASGRKYYYRGELVAEAKGGGLFSRPQLHIHERDLGLQPVDLGSTLAKNRQILQGVAQKSLGFICDAYKKYEKQTDIVTVAFSGGKDSLVLLDLVQRALEPDRFVVVFGDTDMEIKATYQAIERAKEKWHHLNFHIARSHKGAETTWHEMGPPSRIHRWCCSVHKSAPTLLLLRELTGKPSVKALIFDGVRREESPSRSNYRAITEGAKHRTQINASPIIDWNAGEVFLYLFSRGLMLNDAYRYGIVRVGCAVCPMASDWRDMITNLVYSENTWPFITQLRSYARLANNSSEGIDDYLEKGAWRGRAGGRYLAVGGNKVFEEQIGDDIEFSLRQPQENWQEWAKTLGGQILTGRNKGFIDRGGVSYPYTITRSEKSWVVRINGLAKTDRYTLSAFRAVAIKTAFCCHCQSCEVECPTGALSVKERVKIDEICTACGACLDLGGVPCLAAKSLMTTERGSNMGTRNRRSLTDYQTFGMRQTWLADFLRLQDKWRSDNDLGNRQQDSMAMWLRQAELTVGSIRRFEITELTETISRLGDNSMRTWATIWTNLGRNSTLVQWYVNNVPWGTALPKDELVALLGKEYDLSHRTRQNAITALFQLLSETPLGGQLGLGIDLTPGQRNTTLHKRGWKNPDPLSILYSLYRYAEKVNRYELTVRELFQGAEEGPYALFGIERDVLDGLFRGLSAQYPNFIKAEIIRDLDNLFLNNMHTAKEVLQLE